MPYAYNVYTGNGSTTQYAISFPYIRKEHVKVFVNYVDTTFSFANDTTAQLASAPGSGVRVEVRRVTPADNVLVDYTDGSTLTAADLDTNALQQLYLDQELDDAQKQVVTISSTTGLPTLGNQRLTNVSDPTGAQDAATKNYVDTNFQPLDAELTELATMSSGTASALADLTQAETQILDGATVTTAELNTLDGITASTAELNTLDGITATTAELNYTDGVTSAIQTQLDGKQPLDAELTELATMGSTTAAALADLTQSEVQVLDGATLSTAELNILDGVTASTAEINKLDGVTATTAELNILDGVTASAAEINKLDGVTATTAELNIVDGVTATTAELNTLDGITSNVGELNKLDGVTASTSELNVVDGITASTAELNQLDGKSISSTLTPANTNDIPTSSAVNTYVTGLLNALGGFVAIANEISFPTTNPDPSDDAGTVVSIADAGGVVVNGSGVSTTGRTTGNDTVTINGFPSSLHSTTLGAGLGLQVQTTSTLNTYTYHKLIAKEADVKQLSDDINDFQARYRVSDNAPTTDLDEGDLWYDKTANKMKVYDTSTSAWKEVQSIGSYFINTLSSSSGTGGGASAFNGTAYRFELDNAGQSPFQMLVSVNGVIQKPNTGTSQPAEGFAIDNNDIIFAAAPATGSSFFIVTIGSSVNVGTPSTNSVDTAQLVDGAVTSAKLSSSAVTDAKVSATAAIASSKLAKPIDFADNEKARFGTGNDLEIYHDSNHSYIDDSGTGSLHIRGSQINIDKYTGEACAKFRADGNVELYYDNSKKFETKSDGIDVTGEAQCDSLDVDGVANIQGLVTVQAGAVAEIQTVTSASTVTLDFATSVNYTLTLGHNVTLANPSNLTPGQSGSIFLVQDGTGSRTVTFGSNWDFASGTAPTLSTAASSVDRVDYIVRTTGSIHTVVTALYS
jgi:hypothetical protein